MNNRELSHKRILRIGVISVVILVGVGMLEFFVIGLFFETEMLQARSNRIVISEEGPISFNQVDFTWTEVKLMNSNTGEFLVDISSLVISSSLTSGYINISTNLGWVVRNLPVISNFPYSNISTNFDLGTTPGVDITSIQAYIEFSSEPVINFEGGHFTTFPVGSTKYNAEGFEESVSEIPLAPPSIALLNFQDEGIVDINLQLNHPNVEAAKNQCLPASVANSFQWLENTYSVTVPHPNIPGLGNDGSLVGELETKMGRTFTDRRDGEPLQAEPGLTGKLMYLAGNNMTSLEVKHQGWLGNRDISATDPGGDGKLGTKDDITITSIKKGISVTADFIINEIKEGEDVELGFIYSNGEGHFVEVVGAGTVLGVPWILHQSDHDQDDDSKGTDQVDFSYLYDSDGDGYPNLVNGNRDSNIVVVFSQSPRFTTFLPFVSCLTCF